jgi:hypothetical protein
MMDIAGPLSATELAFQAKFELVDFPPELVRAAIVYKLAKGHRLPTAAATDDELTAQYHLCLGSHKGGCHEFEGARACLDEARRLEIISRYEAICKPIGTKTGRVM